MLSDGDYTRRMLQTVLTVAAVAILHRGAVGGARSADAHLRQRAHRDGALSPLVQIIERRRAGGRARVPRWLAILVIYIAIIGVLLLVGARGRPAAGLAGGGAVGEDARRIRQVSEAVDSLQAAAPADHARRSGAERAGRDQLQRSRDRASSRCRIVVGGIFGFLTILILSFYLLVEAKSMFEYIAASSRPVGRARRRQCRPRSRREGQRVAACAVRPGRHHGHVCHGWNVPDGCSVASTWWRSSPRSVKRFRSSGRSSAGVTAVAVAVPVSPKLALMVGIYFFALHQLEANILVPKIMEQTRRRQPGRGAGGAAHRRRALGSGRRDPRDSDRRHPVDHRRPDRRRPRSPPAARQVTIFDGAGLELAPRESVRRSEVRRCSTTQWKRNGMFV